MHPRRSPFPSGGFPVGRVAGIPVFIDWSWLLIFLLITLSISQAFKDMHPYWTPVQHWSSGIITSLFFFASIFLHEMGHSLVARRYGIDVASITLFIFGGVAAIKSEPKKPSAEFWIAIAGPFVSVVLAGAFFGVSLLAGWGAKPESLPPLQSMIEAITSWLATINLVLAIFNLIPGFPLDGGRVLRSIVWAVTNSFERATRVAAGAGQIIAYFFIALGIFRALFLQNFVGGLWMAFIGWFLLNAARSSLSQLSIRQEFIGVRAGDILDVSTPYVAPNMSVQQLVDNYVLGHGRHRFLVFDGLRLRGLITLADIKDLPREDWAMTSLQAVMVPCEKLVAITRSETLEHVMQLMDENDVNQLPVVEGGTFYGMVTREGIVRLLRARVEFRQ